MDPALIEEYHQQLREQQSQFNDCVCVFTGALEAVLSLQTHQDVFYYGSHDGPVRSFNLKNGRRTQVLRGHTSWVNDILIGDNRLLYSCSRDGDVRCWDLEKEGECVKILSSPQVSKTVEKSPRIPINCMGLHNNGSILATGGSDGNVLLWNVNSETIEKVYTGHGASISAVKFRGNHLFSSSWDCFAKVVDIETDQVVSVIKAGNTPIKSLSLSKEEKNTMVLGCNNGSIYVYDTRTNDLVKTLKGHSECVLCTSIYNDYVFSGSDDTYCIQWDLREGKVIHIYSGHQDAVRCLSITEEGDVYSGSFDHSVRRWDMNGVMKLIEDEQKLNQQIKFLEQQQADKLKESKRKGGTDKKATSPGAKRTGSASSSRPSTGKSRPSTAKSSRPSTARKKK